jgi:hypothetical protein
VKHGKNINSASFKLLTKKHVMDIVNYRAPSTRNEEEQEAEEEQVEEVVQPKRKGRSKKSSTSKKQDLVGKENVKNLNKKSAEIAV